MAIIQHFDLNMIPNSEPVIVHVNQYDTGTGRLIAHLYDGDVSYTPTGTAAIQGTKPDGHGFMYAATLSGNTVTADLKDQMSIVAGHVRCQIVVSETSGNTGTFCFDLDVQESALPSDAEMSESDYPIIEELIQDAQEAAATAAQAESNAEASAEDSEAWAVGTRDGVPVPSTDPTYHNNSKYWAEHGGGGEGGHVIMDDAGNDMPARNTLQFKGMTVEDDAVHGITIVTGSEGGSTIKITTTESTLHGEDVTITDGTTTYTETFDNNGVAVFKGVTIVGNLTVSSEDSSHNVAQGTLVANYYGYYEKAIAFWSATINVSTSTAGFEGLTVTAKKNNVSYGSATFSSGSASLTVPETGTYTLEVQYSWATYTTSVNVMAQTTYSATINDFAATVNLETPTADFYGEDISVNLDGSPITTSLAFDNSGEATFTALLPGAYVFTVTYSGVAYTTSLTVSAETTYNNVVIKRWDAILSLSTTSSELDNQTVSVYSGATLIGTTTFSSGSATYTVHSEGTYDVKVTDPIYSYTYSKSIVVSAETTYTETLDTFNATLSLSTSSAELANAQITITKGGVTIGTVSFVSSSASYVVHETGTYTCTCTYQSEDYSGEAVVSAETTYPVSIDVSDTYDVTVTLYSAVADTVTWTDDRGNMQAVTAGQDDPDSVPAGEALNVRIVKSVPHGSSAPSITFTSSVAKDPSDLTANYTKSITITANITEIKLFPTTDDKMMYWYGNYFGRAWTPVGYSNGTQGADQTWDKITNNTNSVFIGSGTGPFYGFDTADEVDVYKAHYIGKRSSTTTNDNWQIRIGSDKGRSSSAEVSIGNIAESIAYISGVFSGASESSHITGNKYVYIRNWNTAGTGKGMEMDALWLE